MLHVPKHDMKLEKYTLRGNMETHLCGDTHRRKLSQVLDPYATNIAACPTVLHVIADMIFA